MSAARTQRKGGESASNAPVMEDSLKEDINYWSLKSSDLYHDLETLKGEAEQDDENMDEEYERLCKEVSSVQSSLTHMRK